MPMSQSAYDSIFGKAWHVKGDEIAKRLVYITNAGTPAAVLVPEFIGQWCFDTAGAHFYLATGLTNADWKLVTI
ncbi:hypothetical protein [Mesorhizobium onobrychidis]|uniref:Uncharacterized protein n=1 Tax=Mesorhizobium onobrychidis TaxID=2775404 RepID=A0ABY5QU52_9HYPH|nr:hypothetical protein [Mesorhizobium onobrychidis]UVC14716.1 hypothetical protein IHQ72_29555 [Mesorhizobium onobrychidis]